MLQGRGWCFGSEKRFPARRIQASYRTVRNPLRQPSTNDQLIRSNHGHRAHVRDPTSREYHYTHLLTRSAESNRSALTRSRYAFRHFHPHTVSTGHQIANINRYSPISSLTTRSVDRARAPVTGDGIRMLDWGSGPPRPPLRARISTRSAPSPAWFPSVAVSSPVPLSPPRCTVCLFPATRFCEMRRC